MNLTESVAKLQDLLPLLKAGDAKFASDLIASFKKYKGLTPKQAPWIERLIARATAPVAPVAPVAAEAVNVGNFAGVIALFNKAKEHLKFPKVRLVVEGKKVVLSMNGPKSKAPGAISITSEGAYGSRTYFGRVALDGSFTPAHACYGTFLTALTGILTELASNPARVAKEHGKLTGNCCFCNKEIGKGEDQRSVHVGFGPVCADHYGLKAEWLSGVAKAEAKASVVAPVLDNGAVTAEWLETAEKAEAAKAAAVLEAAALTSFAAEAEIAAVNEVTAVESGDYPFVTAMTTLFPPMPPKVCFFCETPSAVTKTLHGYVVCATCSKELAG